MQKQLWIAVLAGMFVWGILIAAVLLLPRLRSWIGRRTVGAFSDEASWRAAMERRAAALLRRMPRFSEEDMPAYRLAVRRCGRSLSRLQSRRAAKLLLAAGLYEARNPDLFQAGKDYIAALLTPNGEWAVPMGQEDALLAYAVLTYPGTDFHFVRPAMEQTARLLQTLAGEADTIPSSRRNPSLRLARTVGEVCPFLAAYAAVYGEPFYLNLAMRQIDAYLLNGLHPVQGIPAEGFDCSSGMPLGAFGWSGACAALAFGIMETDRYLPADDARKVKLSIHSHLLADRLRALWSEDGHFPRLPLSAVPDTEAAAVLCVFLWSSYEKKGDEANRTCVRHAMDDLRMRTRKNGLVDFGQPESLRPGFYWEMETPTAGALAAALYAAASVGPWEESPQIG